MEKVKQHYKLGKFTWRERRFVGEQVTLLSDGSITLDQQFYTEARVAPIQISRDRKRKRFSACSPEEIEQLRALVGMPSWLSKETRCDLAGKTALIQQSFPRHANVHLSQQVNPKRKGMDQPLIVDIQVRCK